MGFFLSYHCSCFHSASLSIKTFLFKLCSSCQGDCWWPSWHLKILEHTEYLVTETWWMHVTQLNRELCTVSVLMSLPSQFSAEIPFVFETWHFPHDLHLPCCNLTTTPFASKLCTSYLSIWISFHLCTLFYVTSRLFSACSIVISCVSFLNLVGTKGSPLLGGCRGVIESRIGQQFCWQHVNQNKKFYFPEAILVF